MHSLINSEFKRYVWDGSPQNASVEKLVQWVPNDDASEAYAPWVESK